MFVWGKDSVCGNGKRDKDLGETVEREPEWAVFCDHALVGLDQEAETLEGVCDRGLTRHRLV